MRIRYIDEIKILAETGVPDVGISKEYMQLLKKDVWLCDIQLQEKYLMPSCMPDLLYLFGVRIFILPETFTKTEADT